MSPHRPTGFDAAAAPPAARAAVPVAGPASHVPPADRAAPNALFTLVDQPALAYVDIAAGTLAADPGHESVRNDVAARPHQEAPAAAGGGQVQCATPRRSGALVAAVFGVGFQGRRRDTGTPSAHLRPGARNVAGRDDDRPAARNQSRGEVTPSSHTPAQTLGTPPESHG